MKNIVQKFRSAFEPRETLQRKLDVLDTFAESFRVEQSEQMQRIRRDRDRPRGLWR